MGFFCQNAQEEALKEIAKQMAIANEIELIRELRKRNAISEEAAIKRLRELFKIT